MTDTQATPLPLADLIAVADSAIASRTSFKLASQAPFGNL
jgi:hypothetical protein